MSGLFASIGITENSEPRLFRQSVSIGETPGFFLAYIPDDQSEMVKARNPLGERLVGAAFEGRRIRVTQFYLDVRAVSLDGFAADPKLSRNLAGTMPGSNE